eukprot:763874-Ditylum_brightwellii.AAC.1
MDWTELSQIEVKALQIADKDKVYITIVIILSTLNSPHTHPNQFIASGRQAGSLGVGHLFFIVPTGNQSFHLALAAKALAPLTSQTTETYISSPQLDSTKPTYLLLPSHLQRSAQIVKGSNLVLWTMLVPQTS